MRTHACIRGRQKGAAAVEFAIVASIFLTLLLGIMEFGRVLYMWNAANQATRIGARLAAVCDKNDPIIKTSMKRFLSGMVDSDISVDYQPASCPAYCAPSDPVTCQPCRTVTVEILPSAPPVKMMVPFVNLSLVTPRFSTSLDREFMTSTNNPRCTDGMS